MKHTENVVMKKKHWRLEIPGKSTASCEMSRGSKSSFSLILRYTYCKKTHITKRVTRKVTRILQEVAHTVLQEEEKPQKGAKRTRNNFRISSLRLWTQVLTVTTYLSLTKVKCCETNFRIVFQIRRLKSYFFGRYKMQTADWVYNADWGLNCRIICYAIYFQY